VLALQGRNATAELGELGLHPARLGFEGGDLGRIRPAQDEAAAVGDVVPVVLLVALAGGLDLPRTGDGARLAAELVLRRAAGDVEAVEDLPFEPVVER